MTAPFLRLPLFEGPLDLLLHLCRRHELSLVDLPIAEVTEQFLAYLEVMKELQIEVAGEFVEMAALLCLIKSRELLPKTPDALLDDDGELEDPRAVLVARLLEYKRYRDAARRMDDLPQLHRDFFVRGQPAREVAGLDDTDRPLDVDLVELLAALRDLLERRNREPPVHEIGAPPGISLEERMEQLLQRIAPHERLDFAALFEGAADRPAVIVTFLSLLELARLRLVDLLQGDAGLSILRGFRGAPPRLQEVLGAGA